MFSVLAASDILNRKVNYELDFQCQPSLGEFRMRVQEAFGPTFQIDQIQVFDDVSQQWVALSRPTQLRHGCQAYVFQPENVCQPDVRGAIPPAVKPACAPTACAPMPCAPSPVACSPCASNMVQMVRTASPCNPCAPRVCAAPEVREAERHTTECSVKSFNFDVQVETEIVEKRVEVPVDKIVPVERIIDKIVQVPIEKVVECPIDRIVEKCVQVPIEKHCEVPVHRCVEKPIEVPIQRTVEVPMCQTIDKCVDRVVERVVEVPQAQRHVDKCVPVTQERICEVPVERQRIVERSVERSVPSVCAPIQPCAPCGY